MENNNANKHMPPQATQPQVARSRISWVWLVPVIAIGIGVAMLAHSLISKGPEITIAFKSANGLVAGKTQLKYKDIVVGTVSDLNLSDDGSQVIASVDLVRSARSIVNAKTRFWVVRPRIGVGGLSGIDTLLSGAYIGVDKGNAKNFQKSFTGLENPPAVINGTPGRSFTLHTSDMASLDVNSPVYYKRIQVGRVTSYSLDHDGDGVTLHIFVDAPYDTFVKYQTRFWNASGIDLSLNANGLKLNTQSLATVVAGGIAFATPAGEAASKLDAQGQYLLAADQQTAMAAPQGPQEFLELRFEKSLRGLNVGAPVYFAGVEYGKVVSVDLDYSPSAHRFPTIVGIDVYPQKLGRVLGKLPVAKGDSDSQQAQFMGDLVQHGLRAQARSGSLLTGKLYISIDFVDHAKPVSFNPDARPLMLPTVASDFDDIEAKLTSIVDKVDKLPIDSIGNHLDASLGSLDKTLQQVNGEVLPQTTKTLEQAQQTFSKAQGVLSDDSPLQQNIGQTLQEVQRTAQSLRMVTDLLGRHPESLIRGVSRDKQ